MVFLLGFGPFIGFVSNFASFSAEADFLASYLAIFYQLNHAMPQIKVIFQMFIELKDAFYCDILGTLFFDRAISLPPVILGGSFEEITEQADSTEPNPKDFKFFILYLWNPVAL